MYWKKLTKKRLKLALPALFAVMVACAFASFARAQPVPNVGPVIPVAPIAHYVVSPQRVRKIKAVDADNHSVLINRPGVITVVIGTSEDSQDAARAAGKAMYPFQGRPDFQLIVVVDLRDSIATWAPSIATGRMRSSLDEEAVELKPFFLKNGNKGNPRKSLIVIPDFSGTICPQLGWLNDGAGDLRGILFGVDGREIQRWDKIDDMTKLDADVRAAIKALMASDQAKAALIAKTQGTKLIQPSASHPPLLPPMPPSESN